MADEVRCGVVAIVGEPNAGKSTLINQLVGGKVSIATPKVQTTRFNVRGVCMHEHTQFVFVDTPGIYNPDRKFEKAMVEAAWAGIGDADAVLVLVDAAGGLRDFTKQLLEKIAAVKNKPIFLVLNKIDKLEKRALLKLAEECNSHGAFLSTFMISALKGDGVDYIKPMLAGVMPQSPWLFPEDHMSDIPMRLLAAEITREKLFMKLDKELPYALLVETEKWEETPGLVKIAQVIYVQREGQKKIVLGDKGSMIKSVGISARRELERLVEKKIHLELFVKVKPGWKEDRESFALLGLQYRK